MNPSDPAITAPGSARSMLVADRELSGCRHRIRLNAERGVAIGDATADGVATGEDSDPRTDLLRREAQQYRELVGTVFTDAVRIPRDEPGSDEPGGNEPGSDEPGSDEPGSRVLAAGANSRAVAATVAAVRARAPQIWSPLLPFTDIAPGFRRAARVDLLWWVDDGYVPVIVVKHRVADPLDAPGKGPGPMITGLERFAPRAEPLLKTRVNQRDRIRLTHTQAALEQLGWASSSGWGAVIGTDESAPVPGYAVLHDLAGLKEAYERDLAGTLDVLGGSVETAPAKCSDCAGCMFWTDTCEPELRARGDLTLVVDRVEAARLAEAGIGTIGSLASIRLPGEDGAGEDGAGEDGAGEDGAGPVDSGTIAAPTDWAGKPLETLRLRARAFAAGHPLVRTVAAPGVPRADVELDIDMENYLEDGAYLWGVLRTEPAASGHRAPSLANNPGEYRGFGTWQPVPTDDEARSFAEFWSFLQSERQAAAASGKTFAAYCYSRSAENKWLLRSADRFAGYPGIPKREEIAEFIGSDQWVDMYEVVREQFLSLSGYGLKVLAPHADFQWRDPEPGGFASMLWYQLAVGVTGAPEDQAPHRTRLLEYNEDDVRATRALRDWIAAGDALLLPFADDLARTPG